MAIYKIFVNDRQYTSWTFASGDSIHAALSQETLDQLKDIRPSEHKLFSKDVFLYDTDSNQLSMMHSQIRSGTPIAGVLLLDTNKTYGRSNKRLMYKCIPDDKHLPAFLIPYDPSSGRASFSKIHKNKYVLFVFDHWRDQHPHGKLCETIGNVDDLDAFYEYQLHCKSLHVSLTNMTNKTREQLKQKTNEEYIESILMNPGYRIEDRRRHTNIMTIDPDNSVDFDDAFSIQSIDANTYRLSIYIANVYFWLETLHLWKSFSNRVSTIYLPDRKRPMLPTVLSDNLCSLQQGEDRFAFAMDIDITIEGEIKHIQYKNVVIRVAKNYRYEEPDLLYNNPSYSILYDLTKILDRNTLDSHDVVSYWMIQMNILCGKKMAESNIGIFRQAVCTNIADMCVKKDIADLPTQVQRVIQTWNNISGQYVIFDKSLDIHHDIMQIKNYVHITSPIRRLVDLLNQMWLMQSLQLIENPSQEAAEFLERWLSQLDFLNTSMRSIRKIQTDCNILHRCMTEPHIMQAEHKGILFDKLQKNDGTFIYMVYLEELKMLSRFKSYIEWDNYTVHPFELYLFEDEHCFKKKIRIQMKTVV